VRRAKWWTFFVGLLSVLCGDLTCGRLRSRDLDSGIWAERDLRVIITGWKGLDKFSIEVSPKDCLLFVGLRFVHCGKLVAPTEDVEDGWPAVGVERDGVAGRDVGGEDADGVIFEQEGVILRSRDLGVEFVGPVLFGRDGWPADSRFIRAAG
jgi:hypothetical protein